MKSLIETLKGVALFELVRDIFSLYEWIEKLKNGRTNLTHGKAAGRPSRPQPTTNTERVRDVTARRLTGDEVQIVRRL
jgi:hypothetical protein